jgi:Flp pilus assembly protein TadG
MPTAMQKFKQLLNRFGGDRRGVAAVEFALILPILVVLYFGTVEAASLYTVDRKVTVATATVGDLVSRVNGTISSTSLTDFFQAASAILNPYSTTGLQQVVSVIVVNSSTGAATVCWSRASGTGATAREADSSFPIDTDSQIDQLARGSYLVVSEVSYPYLPLYGMVISSTVNLAHSEYYLPRYAEYIAISGKATCSA